MALQTLTQVQTNHDGVVSRRTFLRSVAAGAALGALGWRDALTLHAQELQRRNQACILLFMRGGPSQFETFDPKPGHTNGGPTQAIESAVPGIRLAEGWTNVAREMRNIALIRSMNNREGEHQRAVYQMHTGYLPLAALRYPSIGSIVASEIGPRDFELPSFVSVGNRIGTIGSGFLGMAHAPFVVGDPNRMPANLERPAFVSQSRFDRRLDLMQDLEHEFAQSGGQARVGEHRAVYNGASRVVRSPRVQAFDLAQETDAVRDRYGRTSFGQGCLLARRLVETGVTFVEVELNGWDTHQDNFTVTRRLGGEADAGQSAERRSPVYVAALVLMLLVLAGLVFLLGKQLGLFSGSTKRVTIPTDVIGHDTVSAQSELQGLGLKVQVQQQQNDAVAQGNVFDTIPKTGTSVLAGSSVTLVVSSGPAPVPVPDVRGKNLSEAQNIITQAGLQSAVTQQNSDTVAANAVIDQSPAAGTAATKGSAVNLVVSSGKTQVAIPDESGHDPTAAANDLGNLGLKVTTAQEASDITAKGMVTRTDPSAGAMVPKGNTVVLYISTGPPPVPVPNVVGKGQAQAQSILTAAGFTVVVQSVPVVLPGQNGQVTAENPAAGTKAAKGSAVTVSVGQIVATTTTLAVTTTT